MVALVVVTAGVVEATMVVMATMILTVVLGRGK